MKRGPLKRSPAVMDAEEKIKRLWLLRHADAEPGTKDDIRPLSPKGIRQSVAMGRFLGNSQPPPSLVLHSGLERAKRTAELVLEAAGWAILPREADGLRPYDPAEKFALPPVDAATVLVVGHEPHLGRLASWLVAGDAGAGVFVMKKGAVLRLDRLIHPMDDGTLVRRWSVRWMATPAILGVK